MRYIIANEHGIVADFSETIPKSIFKRTVRYFITFIHFVRVLVFATQASLCYWVPSYLVRVQYELSVQKTWHHLTSWQDYQIFRFQTSHIDLIIF